VSITKAIAVTNARLRMSELDIAALTRAFDHG
jgi:hypothetical protein